MSLAEVIFGEPAFFDVEYREKAGTWTGQCDEIGVVVEGATLELARNAMRTEAELALKGRALDGIGVERAQSRYAEQLLVRRFFRQSHIGQVAGREPALGPYVSDDGQLRLRDSVVTVMDELGTSLRWLESLTLEDVVARRDQIARSQGLLGTPTSANLESVVSYTDNIVHAMPFDSFSPAEALLFALPAPALYQLDMACSGTLIRGGVDLGSHHASPGLLMGQALIRAHIVECTAKYPAIWLSELASEAANAAIDGDLGRGDVEYLSGLLLRDTEGALFVNYLACPAVWEKPEDEVIRAITLHRDAVSAGLNSHSDDEKVLSKWVWAADYHNHVVRSLNLEPRHVVASTAGADLGSHAFTSSTHDL